MWYLLLLFFMLGGSFIIGGICLQTLFVHFWMVIMRCCSSRYCTFCPHSGSTDGDWSSEALWYRSASPLCVQRRWYAPCRDAQETQPRNCAVYHRFKGLAYLLTCGLSWHTFCNIVVDLCTPRGAGVPLSAFSSPLSIYFLIFLLFYFFPFPFLIRFTYFTYFLFLPE